MATTVFPETNDSVTEAAWQGLNNAIAAGGAWTTQGFDVTISSGLIIDIASGDAFVNGYHISSDATQQKTMTDNTTNYVWIEPNGTVTVNTTGTNPGNALLLVLVVTSGGSISSISRDVNVTSGPYIYIRKAAPESVTSSTTLQDDDDLTVALEPGLYRATLALEVIADASGGIKVALATTATNSVLEGSVYFSSGGTYNWLSAFGASAGITTVFANYPVLIEAMFALADAGTVKFQWSQNASNATATTLEAGSMMFVERIN
jgi:hypothetical protein